MELDRSDGWAPGRWRRWKHPVFPGPVHHDTAGLQCPTCGRLFCLANHAIAADGSVSPSVVCPHPGCSFHEFVRLLGWP